MPQVPILVNDVFDIWGIDFMGPFQTSNGFVYILVQSIMSRSGRGQGNPMQRREDRCRVFAHQHLLPVWRAQGHH
ncbi:unnamed protein product [Rhodiola kirilowii]